MRHRLPSLALLALVATAGIAAVSGPGLAAGSLGITPADLRVESAQRGETYLREVTLQNEFDTASTFEVEATGETGSWSRVEPPSPILVPPREHVRVRVAIAVPADAPNGPHEGALRFVGEAKERPDGSGFSLRHAVAVPIRVDVGGAEVVRLAYVAARAADVEEGTAPEIVVDAVNEGNVRTEARVHLIAFAVREAETPVAEADGSVMVRPGERGEIRVRLDTPLPTGTYAVRVEPAGHAPLAPVAFKVVPVGTLGKTGELHYLRHDTIVTPGVPVRVTAMFTNTGEATIARARLVGEALLGGDLVAVLFSEERTVAPGETVELVAYFEPKTEGEHRIVAHVAYDGFESPPNESHLVAMAPPGAPATSGTAWLAVAAIIVGIAVVAATFVWRRGRKL